MNYEKLKVYQESALLELKVRKVSDSLPRLELFELGSQIRRSAQSVRANIAEGYGRKKHKRDFIRFLLIAMASNDELRSHLAQIKNIYPEIFIDEAIEQCLKTGRILNKFIQGVKRHY